MHPTIFTGDRINLCLGFFKGRKEVREGRKRRREEGGGGQGRKAGRKGGRNIDNCSICLIVGQ